MPAQEASLRERVNGLQPLSVLGTVRSALDIMESAWKRRMASDRSDVDLAACFRNHGDFMLLV